VIEGHPTALQLRYLQTLLELGASQATTIVFPAPIDLFRPFLEGYQRSQSSGSSELTPLSGRLVVVAPNRRRRPGAAAGLIEEPTDCRARGVPLLRRP